MKTYYLQELSKNQYQQLLRRGGVFSPDVRRAVEEICLNVKQRGDEALKMYTAQFDGVLPDTWKVSEEEIQRARASQSDETLTALNTAAANIEKFHRSQLRTIRKVETLPGVVCWQESRPIETVGFYVPGGSAPLPSTVLMLGIPAVLAGCPRIVLCSPPQKSGEVDALVLAAAALVGTKEVYKVGGAQAIAAMAYGTESVPKVSKIFGPGNRYVAAAKRFVASDPDGAAIDLLAGPSELLVIADEYANAIVIAADLLSQAEHDSDAQVVFVTPSASLAQRVRNALTDLQKDLPRRNIIEQSLKNSFVLLTASLDEAIRFANDYAPEHLSLYVREPENLVPQIHSAGSVFLGPYSPVTAGDYASGTNHTLPTGGSAKWTGGISVECFHKTITFQSISREGLQLLAPTLTLLAAAEGLEAHKRAVAVRSAIDIFGN